MRAGRATRAARWPRGHRQILEVMAFRWDPDLGRLPACQLGLLVAFEPIATVFVVDICHNKSPQIVGCSLWVWVGEGSFHDLGLSYRQVNRTAGNLWFPAPRCFFCVVR